MRKVTIVILKSEPKHSQERDMYINKVKHLGV